GSGWDRRVLEGLERFKAMIVGPGLGTDPVTITAVRRVVKEATIPAVVDGDGLTALGREVARFAHPLSVLTPHDGEYERLAGHPPAAGRFSAAPGPPSATGATVLLKGPTASGAGVEGRA